MENLPYNIRMTKKGQLYNDYPLVLDVNQVYIQSGQADRKEEKSKEEEKRKPKIEEKKKREENQKKKEKIREI